MMLRPGIYRAAIIQCSVWMEGNQSRSQPYFTFSPEFLGEIFGARSPGGFAAAGGGRDAALG